MKRGLSQRRKSSVKTMCIQYNHSLRPVARSSDFVRPRVSDRSIKRHLGSVFLVRGSPKSIHTHIALPPQELRHVFVCSSLSLDRECSLQVCYRNCYCLLLSAHRAYWIDEAKVLNPLFSGGLLVAKCRRHESTTCPSVTPRLEAESAASDRNRCIGGRGRQAKLLVLLSTPARTR